MPANLLSRLHALGFAFATDEAAGPAALREELALREFQRYAAEKKVALEAGALPYYADRLTAVENTEPFKEPPHGSLTGETERVLKAWEANHWRCPVVVEAWWTSWITHPNPAGGDLKWHKRERMFEDARAQNLWLYDEGRRIKGKTKSGHTSTAAEQRVRIYAIDRSGWLDDNEVFKQLTAADAGRILLGHQVLQDKAGSHFDGPAASPKAGDVAFPVTAAGLLGASWESLTPEERITYRVVRAVCQVECLGFLDAFTAYDRAYTSLGLCHWTLSRFPSKGDGFERGELEAFLAYLKHTQPAAYLKAFGRFGLEPTDPWYPADGSTKTGLVNSDQRKFESTLREYVWENDAAQLREMPRDRNRFNMLRSWHWLYRFQIGLRVLAELPRAMWDMTRLRIRDVLAVRVPDDLGIPRNDAGTPLVLGDLFRSEELVALLVEWHIWAPATLLVNPGVPGPKLVKAIKAAGKGEDAIKLTTAPKTWTATAEPKLKNAILDTLGSQEIRHRLTLARQVSFAKEVHPSTKEKRLSLVRGSFKLDGSLYPAPPWDT